MINLWVLIKKNIKILFWQKTAAMVFIGPLLITLLAGLAFDASDYNVKIGIFTAEYSPIASSLVQSFSQDNFKTVSYRTLGSCIDALKRSEINLCLHVSQQVSAVADITFYVDYSRLNLVWQLLNIVDSQISSKASELSLNFTMQVLESIETTKNELERNKNTLVTLTTQNDDIAKKIQSMAKVLKSTELNINLTSLDNLSAMLEENKVIYAITKMNENSVALIQAYRDIADGIEIELESSAISEQSRQKLMNIINNGKETMRNLNEKVRVMSSVAERDLNEMEGTISRLILDMGNLREEYYTLYGFKTSGISNLEKILSALDQNLITILLMQKALNKINSDYENLKISDPASALNPIKTTIKPVVAKKTSMSYIFPILLVLMIMFSGMLLAPVLISAENASPARIRNMLTPTSPKLFILATFLSCFVILGVQMSLVAVVSIFFLGWNILAGFPFSLAAVGLIISLFILIGMVLGYSIKSEGAALLSGTLCALFGVIFSDIVLPLESMPWLLGAAIRFNPVIIGMAILKKTLLFNLGFVDVAFDMLLLLVACIILSAIVVVAGTCSFSLHSGKSYKAHAKDNKQNPGDLK